MIMDDNQPGNTLLGQHDTGVIKKTHIQKNDNRRSLLAGARALRFVLSTTPPPLPRLYKAEALVVFGRNKNVRLF